MIQTLAHPKQLLDNYQLQKGLDKIGLQLSELELNDLNIGKNIFLKSIDLGKIGSIFIMASAFLHNNQEHGKEQIMGDNFSKNTNDYFSCSGLALYCWYSENMSEKLCLYFTLIKGIPGLKICRRVPAIS